MDLKQYKRTQTIHRRGFVFLLCLFCLSIGIYIGRVFVQNQHLLGNTSESCPDTVMAEKAVENPINMSSASASASVSASKKDEIDEYYDLPEERAPASTESEPMKNAEKLPPESADVKPAVAPLPSKKYAIQFSSHSTIKEAQKEIAQLKHLGVEAAAVLAAVPGLGTRYRVTYGNFENRKSALNFLKDIKEKLQSVTKPILTEISEKQPDSAMDGVN